MKIKSYSFGEMVIDDRSFHDDLLIVGEEIKSGWYRRRGHTLLPEDLGWILGREPDLLIVGTGSSSRMKITRRVKDTLKEAGIKLKSGDTRQAVELFNESQQEEEGLTGAAFHLTC
ncbi:Mth938-like domain-containing protein [Candidatus Bipolaricaulota bacterium]|nr:Mth938-like domain-containing protein [Candidatus Bipolaricaulota bacterium]